MKKLKTLFAIIILCLAFSTSMYSQTNIEAGVRFGDNTGIDATIPLGISPRLHPTVYLDYFGVGTYFDWMFALTDGPSGLKFYPGVGPEFFFENDFDFNIAGNFGVEYSFKFPLTIGIDWRPAFRTTDSFAFRSENWGITARFRIGEGAKFTKAN